jgi:hypothetical protein
MSEMSARQMAECVKAQMRLHGNRDMEVWHVVETFKVSRTTKSGDTQKVQVQILDSADVNPGYRYNCVATTEDGITAMGNGADTIETAIAIVHWQDLDDDR